MDFRVRLTASANETFSRAPGRMTTWSLLWPSRSGLGLNAARSMRTYLLEGEDEPLRPRERTSISSEQKALEAAEREAFERERTGRSKLVEKEKCVWQNKTGSHKRTSTIHAGGAVPRTDRSNGRHDFERRANDLPKVPSTR